MAACSLMAAAAFLNGADTTYARKVCTVSARKACVASMSTRSRQKPVAMAATTRLRVMACRLATRSCTSCRRRAGRVKGMALIASRMLGSVATNRPDDREKVPDTADSMFMSSRSSVRSSPSTSSSYTVVDTA